ncbi:Methyltransferase-like protein 23 [Apophysomyces ossiformis]|uniref:Methyltransferase-like protein 23 n=1 Tax=Apophysomyces ossiformis TaxID=679940 RepID=A0A8H7BF71_9FUNG|nr:Methyltransferase-like protein 23 [Apophysomyces ossiformis]
MATNPASTALLIGATGAVGKALLKDVLQNGKYTQVITVGRREASLDENIPKEKLTLTMTEQVQKVVDFEHLETHREAFRGVNDVFCCLGTTRADAGSAEKFRRIDQGYVLESAKIIAEENPPPAGETLSPVHFLYCSSSGANKDSSFLYPQSKGQTEEGISEAGFKKVSIVRPGLLEIEEERPKARWGESLALSLLPSVNRLFNLHMSVPVGDVAKAMLTVAQTEEKPTEERTSSKGTKVSIFGAKAIDEIVAKVLISLFNFVYREQDSAKSCSEPMSSIRPACTKKRLCEKDNGTIVTVKRVSFSEHDKRLDIMVEEVLDPAYGCYVWPSAIVMADYVWHVRHDFDNRTILEVGAGTSLPSLVLAKITSGSHFILSDTDAILPVIRSELQLNDLKEGKRLQVRELLWGEMGTPPAVDRLVQDVEAEGRKIDYVLGSDTFYDPADFEKLLMVISYIIHCHNHSCIFLTSYQERSAKRSIQHLLDKWKLQCRLIPKDSFDFDEYRFVDVEDDMQDERYLPHIRMSTESLSSVFLLKITGKAL